MGKVCASPFNRNAKKTAPAFAGAAFHKYKQSVTDWRDISAALIRFIEMHANSELMGVLPEREWIMRAPSLQRKLAQESDEKMLGELKAKGVQIDKVDQGPFMTATAPVIAKWEASPIGPFVKKVVAAARAK